MNELVEAAKMLSENCKNHPDCKGCTFSFSQVCILKWTKPDQWTESIKKVIDRKNKHLNG